MTLNGATDTLRRNIEFKDPCKNSFLEIDAIEDSIQLIINATEPTYYGASWQHQMTLSDGSVVDGTDLCGAVEF